MARVDKAKLIGNFSRHARVYDRYANVQRGVADALLAALPDGERKNIFEIGCGTGYYTRLLREKFRTARLKACDFSERMIEVARQKLCGPFDAEQGSSPNPSGGQEAQAPRQSQRLHAAGQARREETGTGGEDAAFIVADAETMVLDEQFDLVTSNAALQWFEDLGRMLKNCRAALTEDGLLAFSVFGPQTFWELDHCLRRALGRADAPGEREESAGVVRAKRFPAKERIAEMLQESFSRVDAGDLTIREEYPSLRELLAKIKYTGARGDGLAAGPLAQAMLLERVERTFESEFGGVEATYQAFLFLAAP